MQNWVTQILNNATSIRPQPRERIYSPFSASAHPTYTRDHRAERPSPPLSLESPLEVTLPPLSSSMRDPVDVVRPFERIRTKGRATEWLRHVCRNGGPSLRVMHHPLLFVIAPRGISDNCDHASLSFSAFIGCPVRAQ